MIWIAAIGIAASSITVLLWVLVRWCPPAALAWTFASGRRTTEVYRRVRVGPTSESLFVPRYLGSSPEAEVLSRDPEPTSVGSVAMACRRLGLHCELRDLSGRLVAVVDAKGAVRVPEQCGEG